MGGFIKIVDGELVEQEIVTSQPHRQTFEESEIWEISHNKNNSVVITIWKAVFETHVFGEQEFGETPLGGGTFIGSHIEATHEPDIIMIDDNTCEVIWPAPTAGKVVCIG